MKLIEEIKFIISNCKYSSPYLLFGWITREVPKDKKTQREYREIREIMMERATLPLPSCYKWWIFFLPIVSTIILGVIFILGGYEKRIGALTRWTFYGLVFYIALYILILLVLVLYMMIK